MSVNGWRYYNHAAIPLSLPHETPDTTPIENGNIWNLKGGGTPWLARWTTEFDCGHETNWWYVIKDVPFEISSLKSERRYKITKGMKYFDVRKIDPKEYKEELYNVSMEAYKTYPKKYRPSIEHDSFISSVSTWKYIVYGAFYRENDTFCGYVLLDIKDNYIDLTTVKVNPDYEKLQINAAIVYQILSDYEQFLSSGGYICDGSRNISHETAYQDYLEKYFNFRKAYCQLHIEYNPKIKWIIKIVYLFRKLLLKFDHNRYIHQMNSVLKMEELVRSQNE
ncbi:MAG: hypothetical protein K5768_01100 [Firmicutes bacterium]|nr:hypothetical protein [Bacillota bacterium]